MNMFFYSAIILSIGLLAPFFFDNLAAIRYTLIGIIILHFIALAVFNSRVSISTEKAASPAKHTRGC